MTDQLPANGDEKWVSIPDFPHHQASSLGRIRRINNGKGLAKPGLIMAQRLRPNGYLVVSISGRKHFVHRLVCAAFHGAADGREVSHESGDKSDNSSSNLTWRTHKENEALKAAHGTKLMGSACHMARLNETKAMIIRSAYRLRMGTQQQIAEFYGVSRATINDIINDRTWRHVQ